MVEEQKIKSSKKVMSAISKSKFNFSIILLDIIAFIFIYFLIPRLLNMPDYSMNLDFQKEAIGFSFLQVFIVAFILVVAIQMLTLKLLSKNINKYIEEYFHRKEIDYKIILRVRNDCLDIPYKFLIIQWGLAVLIGFFAITFLAVFGKSTIENFDKMVFSLIRIGTIILAFWLLLTVAILVITQNYMQKILKLTYIQTKKFEKIGYRMENSKTLMLQLLPLIFSLLILFAVLAYAKTIQVKSESLANYYKLYMNNIDFKEGEITKDSLLAKLNTIPILQTGDSGFVIDPDNNTYTTSFNTTISDFTIKYRDYFFGRKEQNQDTILDFTEIDGMLYEAFGIDEHLYCKRIYDNNGLPWYIGYKFSVADEASMRFYISCILIRIRWL